MGAGIVRLLRSRRLAPRAHERRALELFRRLFLASVIVTTVLRQLSIEEFHGAARRLAGDPGTGPLDRLIAWIQAEPARFSGLNLLYGTLALLALTRHWTRAFLIGLFLGHALLLRVFAGLANQSEVIVPYFLVFLLLVDFRRPRGRGRTGLADRSSTYLRNLLAFRGLQAQLVLLYVFNGLAKLFHAEWLQGRAAADVLHMEWVLTSDLRWLADHGIAIGLVTYSSLAYELLFPVWVIFARTRRWVVLFGVVMHLLIALAMNQLVGLSLMTAAALVLFHYPDATVRFLSRRTRLSSP